MGVVYEVVDRLDRHLALKVLRPEKAADPRLVEEFLNEAEATRSVGHEHVVQVLAAGEDAGRPFYLMEFVDGPPLNRLLEEKGRLPWPEAVKTALQVAAALRHAHGKGLIHRDVKPQNILLFRDGRARLTDFGIVKDISSLKGFLVKGRAVGTAAYASPEQCLGKRLDSSTDMYSLGATLYHMVCGRPPFEGGGRSETMRLTVGAPPEPPSSIVPDLPKALCNAILRMLEKKQTDRYPSMDRLIRDLEMVLMGRVAIGAPTPRVDARAIGPLKATRRPADEVRKKPRVSPEIVVLILLSLAAAGVALLALLH